jgi:formate/nitrite transporter FocA (FNT family)
LENQLFYGTNLSTNFTCAKWATKVIELLRIWGVVILGNVVGGILFTLFIGYLAPELKLFTHETMIAIGEHVVHYDSWVLFSKCYYRWMAYGIAKLVAQQYYKFHPNFTNFL